MSRRICQFCGKPMTDGMTDLETFYTHEGECFEKEMNRIYGEGMWYPTDDDGEGGYYVVVPNSPDEESKGTGIFYTVWENEEEVEDDGSAESEGL